MVINSKFHYGKYFVDQLSEYEFRSDGDWQRRGEAVGDVMMMNPNEQSI